MHTEPLKLVDVDSHLSDADPARWEAFFDNSSRHLVPSLEELPDGSVRLNVGGQLLPKPDGPGIGNPRGTGAVTREMSATQHGDFCVDSEIRAAVVQPGFVGLGALTVADADARKALGAAHNRRVVDYCADQPALHPAVVVSPHDPGWSKEQLSGRAARFAVSRPTTTMPRPWSTPEAQPLLDHLLVEQIPLFLHGATGYWQASPLSNLFDNYEATRALSHSTELIVALLDLAQAGWLRRGLRVVVLEGGVSWVPWLITLLERMLDISAAEVGEVLSTVLFAAEPGEQSIHLARGFLDDSQFVFGSDYPHWDANPVSPATTIDAWGHSFARQFYSDNASSALKL